MSNLNASIAPTYHKFLFMLSYQLHTIPWLQSLFIIHTSKASSVVEDEKLTNCYSKISKNFPKVPTNKILLIPMHCGEDIENFMVEKDPPTISFTSEEVRCGAHVLIKLAHIPNPRLTYPLYLWSSQWKQCRSYIVFYLALGYQLPTYRENT